MVRKFHRLVFLTGVIGLIFLVVWPFHSGVLRYGLPLFLLMTWTAGLGFLWHRAIARAAVLVLPFLLAVPFLLPQKPIDPANLRDRYVAAMQRMEGTLYLWGGESRWGIDCSGLPRRGLRDALWDIGWESGNGTAFREWAKQWWFDTSAKALGENYRGFTRPLGISGKLRDLDFNRLSPGDLAVTADGRHVMIYLRDGKWIQSDPGPFKVTISKPAMDENPWFDSQVTLHRWTLLDEP